MAKKITVEETTQATNVVPEEVQLAITTANMRVAQSTTSTPELSFDQRPSFPDMLRSGVYGCMAGPGYVAWVGRSDLPYFSGWKGNPLPRNILDEAKTLFGQEGIFESLGRVAVSDVPARRITWLK